MKETTQIVPRYVDIKGLMAYTSMGRNTCLTIGRSSGALIKCGRRNIYDLKAIDSYLAHTPAFHEV